MLILKKGLVVFTACLSISAFTWASTAVLQQGQHLLPFVKADSLHSRLKPMQVLMQQRDQTLQAILSSLPSYKEAKDPDKHYLYVLY